MAYFHRRVKWWMPVDKWWTGFNWSSLADLNFNFSSLANLKRVTFKWRSICRTLIPHLNLAERFSFWYGVIQLKGLLVEMKQSLPAGEGQIPHVSKRECHQTYIKNPSDFHIEKHHMAIMIYEMEGFETQADKRDLKSFFLWRIKQLESPLWLE